MSRKRAQPDEFRLTSLAAHQISSPVAGIKTLLRTVLGEWAGPLTDKQRDLLAKADARCDQALQSVHRVLAIARALEDVDALRGVVDLADLARKALHRYAGDIVPRGIEMSSEIGSEPAYVRGNEAALSEVVHALLDNALKYTPDHGRIRLAVTRDRRARRVRLSLADSGVGIPEGQRGKVFEPFFRASSAKRSGRTGTGLGLAFVKVVAEAAGGTVRADKADLGGAEIILTLPAGRPQRLEAQGDVAMTAPMKVVIVGGVAAGPKVASKVIRLMPDAEVTIIEKDRFLSYAGCGLPYYVSGVVKEQRELMATPLGATRDPVFFQEVRNIRVMNQTEAAEIDRGNKRVRVRNVVDGKECWLDYDKLVLATGASPIVPEIPNVDLRNIFSLHGLHDAEGMKAALARGRAHDVVILGGGLIGVEVTEAIARRGCRVTIVELQDHILSILDWEIARLVEQHMESQGVRILTRTRVTSFEGQDNVTGVVTDRGVLPADMVILGAGVRPNVTLARQAGLELGSTGAIKVDERMQTSDADIFAAGDCVECTDLLTGRPCYVPLGSTANKQGRAAAVNLCGGSDRFPGVLGSTVCKVFDYCVGRTGLTEAAARELGYDVVTALVPAPDRAPYMPDARDLLLKLVVDAGTRKLLGAQATGPGAGDKRIDVAAMALTSGMTIDQLANVDLCYAPPYSDAMDNIITAANVARNKLDGHMNGITPMDVHAMLEEERGFAFLDLRTPAERERVRLPGSTWIPMAALRGRLDEVPKDRPIVTFSELSLRGYEAALVLKAAGFEDVRVMDGGMAMWPYEKQQ